MAGLGVVNVDAGSVLSGLGDLAKSIREAITGKTITDPQKQAELLLKAQELENSANQGAIDIAKIEAASTKTFIAGSRPFILWVCGFSFGWNYCIGPMFAWLAELAGKHTPIPILDLSVMMPVLMALLGLGGMRTYEKFTGTEKNR